MEIFRIAALDVHKKVLMAVVGGAEETELVRGKFTTMTADLRELRDWLKQQGVQEIVLESTAQYWKPVWRELEPYFRLQLANAQSNRAPRGRKSDFKDAERLLRRYLAQELILSFVPSPEQRLWRTLTRSILQLTHDRVRLQNQLEALLEDSHIKLTSCVSDSLGLSSRRILQAIAEGAHDPAVLARLVEPELRATPRQLEEALVGARDLSAAHRQILKLLLERVELLDQQRQQLEQTLAEVLRPYSDSVTRLTDIPGFGVNSAQQVIAEIGPTAASFPSPHQLASWMGACPGRNESAGVSTSDRSPKGNRQLRRVLTQVAHAAIKNKGNVFHAHYLRLSRKGHNLALWAVVHHLCRLVWKILHQGLTYFERGQTLSPQQRIHRKHKLVRQLRQLGYTVQLAPAAAS